MFVKCDASNVLAGCYEFPAYSGNWDCYESPPGIIVGTVSESGSTTYTPPISTSVIVSSQVYSKVTPSSAPGTAIVSAYPPPSSESNYPNVPVFSSGHLSVGDLSSLQNPVRPTRTRHPRPGSHATTSSVPAISSLTSSVPASSDSGGAGHEGVSFGSHCYLLGTLGWVGWLFSLWM